MLDKNKMKPFDLIKALNGERVVTRSNEEVTQLVYFKNTTDEFVVFGIVEKEVKSFTIEGRYNKFDSPYDLFMCEAPEKIYFNLYYQDGGYLTGDFYDSQIEAQKQVTNPNGFIKTIEIEI